MRSADGDPLPPGLDRRPGRGAGLSRLRGRWPASIAAAVVAILITHAPTPVAAGGGQDLVGQRVRIQAPALGAGWHEGMFNRTRTEPPCFVVLLFKPRASPSAAIEVAATLPLAGVARLAVFTGAPAAMAAWAGLAGRDASGGDWREVDLATIRPADEGTRCAR